MENRKCNRNAPVASGGGKKRKNSSETAQEYKRNREATPPFIVQEA